MLIKFFLTFSKFMENQKLEIDLNIVLEEIYGNCVNSNEKIKDNITIYNLIHYLDNQKQGFKDLILEEGKIRPYIKILINGRHINFLEGLDTILNETDTIAFFPAVAGG
ncbi:MAG: MoaD/ThiS family protein [Candidatus Hodarchaeota archaeon]